MSTDVPHLPHGPASSAGQAAPPLPDDPEVLKRMICELLATLHDAQRENEGLRHRLDQLLQRLYGPRAEKFDPHQPWLFPELQTAEAAPAQEPPAQDTPAAENDQPKKKKQGHGRNGLPKDLRREERRHELPEAQRLCPCCGKVCQPFGSDTSQQLDYQPASLFIIEHQCVKYACPECHDHVVTATKPPAPIAKGLPGPGLLAIVTVSKYTDHLPLHRQERIFARQGVELSRQTLCDWMAQAATLLEPLYRLMVQGVLQSRSLHTDETPVQVQDDTMPNRTRTGRMWLYLGDRDHAYNVFDFSLSREKKWPQQFLGTWSGYLHADAFTGYDALFTLHSPHSRELPAPVPGGRGLIWEVACWAHARRKFYEARTSDAARSHQALAHIRKLYDSEDEAKDSIERAQLQGDAADAVRFQFRQEKALLELTAIRHWLLQEKAQVLPKSPMAEAIDYAMNQWDALTRYTDAGFLDIDNNIAERALRAIAVGRKNWLFCGSAQGGKTAAILFSFTSTCRRHDLDPFAYLRDVYERLPSQPPDRLEELLPDRWKATQAALAQTAEPPPTAPPAPLSPSVTANPPRS